MKKIGEAFTWTDGKVGNLEVLDAVDIQSFIKHTMLDHRITLLGRHAAGTQTVPSGLTVSLHPFFNVLKIFIAILERLPNYLSIAVEEIGLWWSTLR